MLTIIEHWRLVLKNAWSVRFIYLSMISTAIATALPYAAPAVPAEYVWKYVGVLLLALMLAAVFSRVVEQKAVKPQDPQ